MKQKQKKKAKGSLTFKVNVELYENFKNECTKRKVKLYPKIIEIQETGMKEFIVGEVKK